MEARDEHAEQHCTPIWSILVGSLSNSSAAVPSMCFADLTDNGSNGSKSGQSAMSTCLSCASNAVSCKLLSDYLGQQQLQSLCRCQSATCPGPCAAAHETEGCRTPGWDPGLYPPPQSTPAPGLLCGRRTSPSPFQPKAACSCERPAPTQSAMCDSQTAFRLRDVEQGWGARGAGSLTVKHLIKLM